MKELKKIKFDDVYKKLESDQLNPYQFYNSDLGSDQFFAIGHYLDCPDDNIEQSQKLKKVFFDIECFQEHQVGTPMAEMVMQGKYLVNAISHYYSSENKFYCYFVLPKGCRISKEELETYLQEESTKEIQIGENEDGTPKMGTYFEEGQTVEVQLFESGIDLVIAFWEKVKENDPAIYSGWNSDQFDTPYLYHYLLNYLGDHQTVANIMSNFGEVSVDDGNDRAGNKIHRIRIVDFINLDLLYSYKERAD